ncbi:555_t:CDS:2 [Paraglomus occultum]|uniref:555_t:CDS:1 n=1 Tax=Paraglomus occultum TaxID=144539 RepID=A0A9N9AS74_9GLOM|nr:555_t:CDS:2 [Paraglomus occultum]
MYSEEIPTAFNLESALLSSLKELYEKQLAYDVTITVGEGPITQEFKAHKCILCVRSPYFYKHFLENKEYPAEEGLALYNSDEAGTFFKEMSPLVFAIMLEYIYTGMLQLDRMSESIDEYLQLVSAIDLLELQKPSEIVQDLIHAKFLKAMETTAVTIKSFCEKHPRLQVLNNLINAIFEEKPESVLDSSDFTSLDKESLIDILKRPDLNLQEIVIWDKIIEWAIAQDPELPENIKEYKPSEKDALKDRLKDLWPLIKFVYISAPDFHKKIHPYKCIFPEDFYEDLLEHYFDPSNSRISAPRQYVPFEANLLLRKHCKSIETWIQERTASESLTKKSYLFKRIFCGSIDGLDKSTFSEKCVNKGPTVFVVSTNGTGRILGGYNPFGWEKSSKWFETKDSFIFLMRSSILKTEDGVPLLTYQTVLSSVKNSSHAIYNQVDGEEKCHFSFGGDLEVYISSTGHQYVYKHGAYSQRLLEDCVCNIDEIEVFQVIVGED